jgi:competence protein ComEC
VKKAFILLLVLFILLPLSACSELQIHFLDVGQGDCTIVLCDGESMVIDGGPRASTSTVYNYVKKTLKLQHIDYVISTHPHLDHVYGLSSVLNAAPVDLILSPVLEWDSKAFEFMLKYAEKQGTPISVPQEGDTLQLGGATVTILHCWPEAIDYGRTNDSSIVVRIDYGKTSFIITGDAEDWSEYMMIDSGMNLKADVLRVAHHGSNTASTAEFLQAVNPEYAVISVGKDNGYGHPHAEVLDRLEDIKAKVLRTDELGTIVIQSDGDTLTLMQ